MEASKQPTPEKGMGATVCSYTDRYAGTVIDAYAVTRKGEVVGHEVVVQEDKATRTDDRGFSDAQTYDYAPDPDGRVYRFRMDKSGTYRSVDDDTGRMRPKGQGYGLCIGHRDKHHDFSF